MSVTESLDWHVAIYVANEAGRLAACIASVVTGLADTKYRITILLNGTNDGGEAIAVEASRRVPGIEVFTIRYPDKSNAINQFYHKLRMPARLYGEVDGNVLVREGAFAAMAAQMDASPIALTVSGFSMNGRTLPRPSTFRARGGRLMGQMHILRPRFLDMMVARGIKLPVGLYRGDGLIGSMAAHQLDPMNVPWDDDLVQSCATAEAEIYRLSPFKFGDVQRQFRRKIRQMQGLIENAAIKDIIYRQGFEGLPTFADDMIAKRLATHGAPKVSLVDRAFMRMAIRQSAAAKRPSPEALTPTRI